MRRTLAHRNVYRELSEADYNVSFHTRSASSGRGRNGDEGVLLQALGHPAVQTEQGVGALPEGYCSCS